MATRPEPPDAAIVREFLNHLREPRWLRRSAFVTRYLSERVDLEADDYRLLRAVRATVGEAVRDASPRARAVLERTALDGETSRSVARALGISERQVHRDRTAAIATLAANLARGLPAARIVSDASASDVFDARLGQASMLGELGLFDRAERLLRDVVRAAEDKADKSFALARMARLSIARGHLAAGREHAQAAIAAAHGAESVVDEANARSAMARLLTMAGCLEEGRTALRESLLELRPLVTANGGARAGEALIETLLGQWEAYRIAGFPQKAETAARQADVLMHGLERPSLHLRLAAAAAVTDCALFLWSNADSVEAQADAYYATAVAGGSTCGTLLFAIYRSYVAHYKGRFEEQAALLHRLLPIAADLANCTVKIYFLAELGVALTHAGNATGGLRALEEAAKHAPPEYGRLRGYVGYSHATVALTAGDAHLALSSADDAIALLSHPRDDGLLGPCVAKKAQALSALGRFREALDTAELARRLLGTSGQPVIAADTRRMIGRLKRRLRG